MPGIVTLLVKPPSAMSWPQILGTTVTTASIAFSAVVLAVYTAAKSVATPMSVIPAVSNPVKAVQLSVV